MYKWVHRLSAIDIKKKKAICAECGVVKIYLKKNVNNKKGYVARCVPHRNKLLSDYYKRKSKINPKWRVPYGKDIYKRYKEGKCSVCEFVPINMCQMDVDHIDGNHAK